MKKKLLSVLSLLLALTAIFVLAGPALADVAPNGANSNSPTVAVNRPAIVYHVGDVIHYEVVVGNAPASGISVPAYQTGVAVTFDPISDGTNSDGTGDDTPLATIASLLPGESVTFTAAGASYVVYSPQAGQPTRAELTAPNTTFAMPASPTYITDTATYAGSYPILNHTIIMGELFLSGGVYQETAIAHIVNGPPTGGAHDAPNFIDSNDKLGSITTGVSIANTTTTISANATAVDVGQSVTLTITEQNTGDVDLTSPHVVVLKNNVAFMDLVAPPTSGDTHLPTGILNGSGDIGAETWTWVISSGALTGTTTFQATGHGLDDSESPVDITYPGFPLERQSVTISVNTPNTITHISANPTVLDPAGGTVTLIVTEINNGAIALNNPNVVVTNDINATTYTLTKTGSTSPAVFNGTDTGNDGILGISETWQWTIAGVPVSVDTTFTATGDGTYGTDPVTHVTFPGTQTERESVSVTVSPPHQTPASSDWGIGILIAGFAVIMSLFIYRRTRRSQIS